MNYESNEHGHMFTKLDGRYHSFNDRPALICANGDKFWYKEGKRHRDSHFSGRENDLPAVIEADGTQRWYKEDKLHRDGDLPALIYPNGNQHWYIEDKLHRDGGLPAVICANGDRFWFIDGTYIKHCYNYNPRVKSARNI